MAEMRRCRDAPVRAGIDAQLKARETATEFIERPRTAAGKARFFPDFIEPARIAGVTAYEIGGADAQPARDPDVDGVVLAQWTAGDGRWRCDEERGGHERSMLRLPVRFVGQLDVRRDPLLIAPEDSRPKIAN